jgi:hypothetical protein
MLYAFFWVIPRGPKFICRRFVTLCLFHLHRLVCACRMNSAEDMLGYYTGEGLAWKWLRSFPSQTFSRVIPQHVLSRVHSTRTYLPMKMEQTECSETSAYEFQTPGNHPKESIQHSVHGKSLKSR